MREILFRGKRLDNGEWVEGQTIVVIHQDDNDLIFMPQHGEDVKADPMEGNDRALTSIYGNYYQILPQTVGQFTGLTDKNGKKIFEGDILAAPDYPNLKYKVSFANANFCVKCPAQSYLFYLSDRCFDMFGNPEYEIVGNIHDNPELLEEKE